MASISVDDFYKKDGLIAQVKPGFAQREGQQKLSELIYNQLELGPDGGGEHVLAEGPTGFGKSIALLVPAIVAVLEGKATRVVISTETLALQDQYVTKDLPLLLAAVEAAGYSFTFAAAKGRSNYGCLAKTVGSKDFALTPVQAWLKTQKVGIDTGDLGSVPDLILPDVRAWTDVGADEDCERRGCRFYGDGPKIGKTDCFVYAARRDYLNAQIIVTNHTMLLLDRQHTSVDTPEGPVLGPYDLLIVDEAHTLPEKAAAAWGFELGARTLSSAVRFVQKVLTRMHFECVTDDDVDGFRALETRLLDLFTTYTKASTTFDEIEAKERGMREDDRTLAVARSIVKQDILPAMKKLLNTIKAEVGAASGGEDTITSCREKLNRVYLGLQSIFCQDASDGGDSMQDNWLSFVEANDLLGTPIIKLKVKPIEVAPLLAAKIWKPIKHVVLASATLRERKRFTFIRREMGLPPGALEFVGKTPFNFIDNVKGYFPIDLPHPPNRRDATYREDFNYYVEKMTERIVDLIEHTNGGALVLFTSAGDMKAMHEAVEQELWRRRLQYKLLLQGTSSKNALVREMKADMNSCLFATKSFFTGVDIPGQALRSVIVMKAPFRVPSEPLFAARCAKVRERGQSDFLELSLPLMLFDMVQAFGRLIRTEQDHGVFALLDSRANAKGYGKDIIAALPKIGRLDLVA